MLSHIYDVVSLPKLNCIFSKGDHTSTSNIQSSLYFELKRIGDWYEIFHTLRFDILKIKLNSYRDSIWDFQYISINHGNLRYHFMFDLLKFTSKCKFLTCLVLKLDLLKNKMKSIRNYLWHSSHSSYMHKLKSEYIMIYPTDTKQYSQACIEFNNTLSLSFSLSFMPHKFYSIEFKNS